MDPRVPVTSAQLRAQYALARKIVSLMAKTANKHQARYNAQLSALLDAVESADAAPTPAVVRAVRSIELKVTTRQ
jgi:hypothetical protein